MQIDLAVQVVTWQKTHGRNDLPWQNTRDPYRVWLSEVMLQQTQVATVLDYFPRFLARFPDVAALAAAPLDDVLGLWSGLGYYSRARNLHLCAVAVMGLHGGVFPQSAEQLQTLPGIGRSTAAAIASLCFAERVAILDGNVKRVLTRVLGFDADLSSAANERLLWEEASKLLPVHDLLHAMPRYTQGVMDLGATVCTTKKPDCRVCPLAQSCVAREQGQPEKYPVKTRKLKRSAQSIWLLWAQTGDASVWLSKRPTPGVWAGLYCFPLFDNREALELAVPARYRSALQDGSVFTHVLTHKDLHLHPVQVQLPPSAIGSSEGAWLAADEWPRLGLPAPVRKLLAQE
ncbi:MAG: A/G-specific adenine glycosylase [Rhodoferax sp.]|uniref:A/G-specific adenine glycosylase n=1 Tax=Rhodoferax sp. TaxID=50421 RepID=UPI00184ADA97|nr:A/G-specific adenine glycosylase [Rhodoferax sp.]NMM13504.1 A/G-specific adenine glycosylase [Rhodoferax sp.]NMM20629.1 A/G-specific adenine glycosylase [Rhodoferax sp.]